MFLVAINEMKNAQLQEELKKMKIENQRLRDMLSQAATNFNALQMQLITVMRQQEQRNSSQDHLLVIITLIYLFYLIDLNLHPSKIYIYSICIG